jgi:hypothetical protein
MKKYYKCSQLFEIDKQCDPFISPFLRKGDTEYIKDT